MSNRKRLGKRERAHMKYAAKNREHETLVARRIKAKRAWKHHGNLVANTKKLIDAERIENKGRGKRVEFLRRLLGWE